MIFAILERLFPTSFAKKLFFGAFIGTHIPLITMVLIISSEQGGLQQNLNILAPFVVITVLSTIGTMAFIKKMLRPLHDIAAQMKGFEKTGELPDLPVSGRDELGYLMRRTNELCFEMRSKIEHIHDLANTDHLTQALNRRGFEVATQNRVRGAVLALDIDHFKRINDKHGHQAGDKVLIEIVKSARCQMRETDIICRSGGEEFIIYLKDLRCDDAWAIAERIRSSIEQNVTVKDNSITVSIGVLWTKTVVNAASAIISADNQLYKAKLSGRNQTKLTEKLLKAA